MGEQAFDSGLPMRLAACVLDLQASELRTLDGRPVDLRPKARNVLLVLAEHAGHVVDKSTLMERVWPGAVVGDDSLTQTIVEIRRALGDLDHKVLCTVARRGYRLLPGEASATAAAPALSVAVLPIAHDTGDADSARVAASLTFELTSRAGIGLPDSKVLSRETVAALGAGLTDPRAAARRLGVQQVVCGELHVVAGGWSLALAVVDGASGARGWSHRFAIAHDRVSEQIATVAAQAAHALLVEMHRSAAATAAANPPGERSAGEFALQGWASIYGGISPDNLERARHFFEQAVAKDPSHFRGLCGLCISNHWRSQMGWAPDHEQARRCVLDTAARLEKLYPDDKLTALASGSAADVNQDWELRLAIGDRLCQREPDSPTSHFARGVGLLRLGRFDECLGEIDDALRLSVDDFRAGWWHSIAGFAHLASDRPGVAVLAARQAIAANACLPLPPLVLAAALAGDGGTDKGREVLRQHLARERHVDRGHVQMVLGGGNADYLRGCARFLATLVLLGLPGD